MRRHLVVRAAVLAVFATAATVAAFATIAPHPQVEAPPPAASLVEILPIPSDALLPAPESYIREEIYQAGDTLPAFLARFGIGERHAQSLARLAALKGLRPGQHVKAEISDEGEPLSLSFLTSRDTLIQIAPEGEGFKVTEERAALYTEVAMKGGTVESSLFAATDAAGIPDSVAMQFADIFSGDVDFHRDLRRGDEFAVVYELHHVAGRPVRAGRVLAAEFVSQGKTHRAVYFAGGYYTPDGKNLRKTFLRSPLEFSRVTSGFGKRRHPIAQAWRAHKGIDYAAPAGTRVRATGDGVVEFAGVQNGYGKVVVIRHAGEHTTLYAHLSRIAVRPGARVSQNDTIGFVGRTGWATGPHLHYEFLVRGQARNPLTVAMPSAHPVPAHEMAAFRAQTEPLIARLELLGSSNLALLE